MKKEHILIYLAICVSILFISTSLASAITDNAKAVYSPEETMIVKLSGNILEPITLEQIEFYRGHVLISREYDVKKLGDNYYFWAISPLEENNYSFVIKDLATTVNGKTTKVNYEKNFSVEGNLTDYLVNPGIIYSDKDFSINVRLNEDVDKIVDINFPINARYLLKPGDNEIKFSISNFVGENLTTLQIGKYSIPAYLKGHEPIEYKPLFLFNPRRIESTILISDNISLPIVVINTGNGKADELIVQYNSKVFSLDNNKYTDVSPGESIELNLRFNKEFISELSESSLSENLSILYDNRSLSIPIDISFTKNQTKINNGSSFNPNYLLLCLEMNGTKCPSGSTCSIGQISAKDGLCCKGQCSQQKGNSGKVWLGFGILVLIVAIVIVFLLKYHKAGLVKNPIQREISRINKDK